MIASVIETCKLIAVEPYRYLVDVTTRIVDDRSQSRLDELLPWVDSATPNLKAVACQFASNRDPLFAPNRDPSGTA